MVHNAIGGAGGGNPQQNLKIIRKSKYNFSTQLFTYISLDCYMVLGRKEYFHSKLLNTKVYSKGSYNEE